MMLGTLISSCNAYVESCFSNVACHATKDLEKYSIIKLQISEYLNSDF